MRILYLQQLLVMPGSSGNPRSIEQACEWVLQGHEVTILCSKAAFPDNHLLKERKRRSRFFYKGVEIICLPVTYAHMMSFGKRALRFLHFMAYGWWVGKKLSRPNLILAYSAPLSVGYLGHILAKKFNVPWVFEIADVWPDVPIGMGVIQSTYLQRFLLGISKKLYASAEKILPFTPGMEAQIRQHGVSESKIEVIHNGIDLNKIVKREQELVQHKLVHIFYAGTIGIANRLCQLVELARMCQERGQHSLRFHVVGNGNDAHRVKELADNYQLNNLYFYDQVPQQKIAELLNQADIGIISFAPYEVLEANGATKFYDYLASGLPVLINYKGWQAELLEKHNCGFSTEQGDLEQWYENVVVLANDPILREEMGANGRELARKFDRKITAGQTLRAMKAILSS